MGAIAPSSPALAAEMVRGLEVGAGDVIVEFGPGTGPFTAAIEPLLGDASQYLGVERDPKFVEILRGRFPQLRFAEDGAQNTLEHLSGEQVGRVKAVLCGLPFASLPPSVQDAVVGTIEKLLGPGCEFRTFQYVHAYQLPTARRFRKMMGKLFGECEKSRVVVRNLPPAYVLKWTGK